VFGGKQMRPNIHIEDVTDLYCMLMEITDQKIAGKTFNAGYQNHTVLDLAKTVQKVVAESGVKNGSIELEITKTDDERSYHISSDLIKRELGYIAKHTIEDAVRDLVEVFQAGKLPNAMTDPRYYNLKTMQGLDLALTST